MEEPFGDEESNVSAGFGFVEDQINPDNDAEGESDFGAIKGVE